MAGSTLITLSHFDDDGLFAPGPAIIITLDDKRPNRRRFDSSPMGVRVLLLHPGWRRMRSLDFAQDKPMTAGSRMRLVILHLMGTSQNHRSCHLKRLSTFDESGHHVDIWL
jgi:hypothetical protein